MIVDLCVTNLSKDEELIDEAHCNDSDPQLLTEG